MEKSQILQNTYFRDLVVSSAKQSRIVVPLMRVGRDGGDRGSRWRERSCNPNCLTRAFSTRSKLVHQKVTCYLKSYFGVAVGTELLTPMYQDSTGAELPIMSYILSDHPISSLFGWLQDKRKLHEQVP